MKLRWLLAGLIIFCSLLVLVWAEENKQKTANSTVEKDLQEQEAKWGEAVESNDADRIARFFTNDFLFVGAGGILQDRKQHLEDFRSGRLKVKSVKIGNQTIHLYANAAVVSSQVAVQGKFGDRDITGPYQFTDTWVKQDGRWLAAARQQTRVAAPPASAVVKDFFAAFAKGDIPAVLKTLSPDIDWLIAGPPAIPYAGHKQGHARVKDFFKAFADAVDVQKFEPKEFVEQDGKVVVLGYEDLRVKATGKTVHNPWALVFDVSGGNIVRFQSYEDTAALVAAFTPAAKRSQAQSAEKKEEVRQKKQGQEKSPPQVEEGKKTVNGVELYYKAIGSGDTIIVLHGGPGLDHTGLLPQYEQLAKDFRLLFYDQRACGKSSGSFDEKSINVDTYVDDLDGIREAFGIKKANILGYSWGGLLGMFYTIKHPEAVDKLILVDSAEASSADSEDFGKVLAQRRSDAEKKELARIRNSPEYLAGDPKAVTASLRLGFRAYCFDPDRAKDITLDFTAKSGKAFIEVGNLFDKTLFDPGYDIHSKLKAITCPTLVVHGDTDPIEPKFLKKVSEEIKGSRFVLLDKCGHFSHVEQPTKLFDQITWFMRGRNQEP